VNRADFAAYRPFIGTSQVPAQLAAGGEGPGGAAALTPDELAPVLSAAVARWAAAGLSAADVALLRGVTARITVLPYGYLGAARLGGDTIYLSADGAGHGWSLGTSAAPSGGEDLLTVVMHELGHTLRLDDLAAGQSPADLMAQTLALGVRRLPSASDVASLAVAAPAVPLAAPANAAAAGSAVLVSDGQGTPAVSQEPDAVMVVPAAPPPDLLLALAAPPGQVAADPAEDSAAPPSITAPAATSRPVAAVTVSAGLTDRASFLDVALSLAGDGCGTQPDPWAEVFGETEA
jgi:hypothetical protein